MAFANDFQRNVAGILTAFPNNPETRRKKSRRAESCRRMRSTIASFLLLFLLIPAAHAQTPQEAQQSQTLDSEYRKFDTLLTFLRNRNAQQYAITSPKGIDESLYVTIGGIEQWITIRGWDRDNPVLLFLHGGPGDVTNPWSFAIFAPWEKHFTVVQWDQRGAGRTLRKNGTSIAPTITVDRIAKDGIELTDYLRQHLKKEKIIIVAHSFGSIIGLRMARAKPADFYAYIGTGQVADETRNYSVAYDALLKKAHSVANQQAIDELTRVGPPPYATGEGYATQRKWANAFEGADQFLMATIGLTLVAPGNSVEDINDSAEGQMLSADHLVPETKSEGPEDLGLEFRIPIIFIQGAEDFTTPTSLAKNYLDTLDAPHKQFVTIENAGHFAVFIHSDQFLHDLITLLAPLELSH